jgi:prolyl-tRNA editing enzyme YbaK/EbsC (Cys-tRNA(Pro) deacylase)
VQEALRRLGVDAEVVEMPSSTRTAPEAAAVVGCQIDQIVKSLVFRSVASDRAVMVLASGADRVDEGHLAEVVGEDVTRADATFVKERTGFAIGGVPPLGHTGRTETYMDEGLLHHQVVWAAAGTPRTVFPVAPAVLAEAAGARVVSVCRKIGE